MRWGHSRGSVTTERKVLAGEKLTEGINNWLDSCAKHHEEVEKNGFFVSAGNCLHIQTADGTSLLLFCLLESVVTKD